MSGRSWPQNLIHAWDSVLLEPGRTSSWLDGAVGLMPGVCSLIRARWQIIHGELSLAERELAEARLRLASIGDALSLSIAQILGAAIRLRRQDAIGARVEFLSVLNAACDADQPWPLAYARSGLADALAIEGDLEGALRYALEALDVLEACDDLAYRPVVHNKLGQYLVSYGLFDEAQSMFEAACQLCQRFPDHVMRVVALANLAICHCRMGDIARAESLLAEFYPLQPERINAYHQANVTLTTSKVLALLGRADEAMQLAAGLDDLIEPLNRQGFEAHKSYLRTLLAFRTGQTQQAKLWLAEAESRLAGASSDLPVTLYELASQLAEVTDGAAAALGYLKRMLAAETAQAERARQARARWLRLERELKAAKLERAVAQHDQGLAADTQRKLADERERLARHIVEVEDLQCQLRLQAVVDPLTGLYNRRYCDDALPRELMAARNDGLPLAVAMIDLDFFKLINDQHGHQAGDAALVFLARFLRERLRGDDVACRVGGEEFCLILRGSDGPQAVARLADILHELLKTRCPPASLLLSYSAGVAAYPADGCRADVLLRCADRALYTAKRAGRQLVIGYSADLELPA